MRKSTALYCFSPPVMLATFVIEISLLVYTLVRYKMSPVVRVASTMLLMLAVFQLAEFNVCGNLSPSVQNWSRVGFVAITLLPALGVHLTQLITRRPFRFLTIGAYGTALIWAGIFGLSAWAFSGHVCEGNYVIFQLRHNVAFFYAAYYYFWILTVLTLCYRAAKDAKVKVRHALGWLAIGYLVFLVPTAAMGMFKPETTAGIPSIMCGFAILFAFILVFAILPKVAKKA